MAKIESLVISTEYRIVFIPFAAYKLVGDIHLLTVFGLTGYKRVGDACSLMGVTYQAGDGWAAVAGGWRHRPLWKVLVNSCLRGLQFWTRRPLLVATDSEELTGLDCSPMTLGYRLCRVELSEAGHAS